jgi:hypothetical protein
MMPGSLDPSDATVAPPVERTSEDAEQQELADRRGTLLLYGIAATRFRSVPMPSAESTTSAPGQTSLGG